MDFLSSTSRTFRAEKMPLCYIRWYEWCSTETRKIVKDEERIVYFLDFREKVHDIWDTFVHDKLEECKNCDLNPLCVWIFEREAYYNYVKVYPQKLTKREKEEIIKKIND
jgi:hypothetical protein